ncbi:MAG TPA: hypothetical protein VEB23_12800, partial [Ramlibacter sp.]|nr:hypothetical protein [Ramlibacter sp.]
MVRLSQTSMLLLRSSARCPRSRAARCWSTGLATLLAAGPAIAGEPSIDYLCRQPDGSERRAAV